MYLTSGLSQDRPVYYNSASQLYLWYSPSHSRWTISGASGSSVYRAFAAENVATPDLLSATWTVQNGTADAVDGSVQAVCSGGVPVALGWSSSWNFWDNIDVPFSIGALRIALGIN